MAECTHRDTVALSELPESVEGCEDCLKSGGEWNELRLCVACGHVGCCDDSPAKHATRHAWGERHPIMRTLEPDQAWAWCFFCSAAVELPHLTGSPHIPPSPLAS